ncbi:MAG TPA: alpha/beta hydrolase [Dehalococcoidia bacterium]|nr:alpha/beta hydrolase [Dehalococcoidia bacterium]
MATLTSVSLANAAFTIRVWSEGAGRALLYLHGFEGHPGDAPFLQRLAQGRRVIAPEAPGFGASADIEQIDDVLDLALFYRQLIEALGLGEVDLIGHSLGGMFAAEIAAICPQHVRRLVLVSPFGLWLEEAEIPDFLAMSAGQLARAAWHDPESVAAQTTLGGGTNGASPVATAVQRASNLSAAGKFLWPIPDRGLHKRLPLIAAPALVVRGASDKLIPAPYGKAFAGLIPHARLVTIADAGHTPQAEQPDAFLSVVEPFLAG